MTNNITNGRDAALDFMRGVAIGLVLLGHVLQKEMHVDTPLFRLLCDFHMPFFFVLCGWLSGRATSFGWPFWRKKAHSLLLPMLTVGGTFALATGCGRDFLLGDFHAGYWFLLSLFEIWAMFALMRTVCRWLGVRNAFAQAVVLLVPFAVAKVALPHVPEDVQHALTLSMTTAHYRWFVLGHFLGGNVRLRRWLDREAVRAVGIVTFLMLLLAYLVQTPWLNGVPLTALQAVLCLSCAISCLAAKDATPCMISRCVQNGGGKSLHIYIFHYYIVSLFDLSFLQTASEGIRMAVALLMVLLLAAFSLAVGRLLETNRFTAFLLLGKKLKAAQDTGTAIRE